MEWLYFWQWAIKFFPTGMCKGLLVVIQPMSQKSTSCNKFWTSSVPSSTCRVPNPSLFSAKWQWRPTHPKLQRNPSPKRNRSLASSAWRDIDIFQQRSFAAPKSHRSWAFQFTTSLWLFIAYFREDEAKEASKLETFKFGLIHGEGAGYVGCMWSRWSLL